MQMYKGAAALVVAASSAALLWAAVYNGQPFFYADTGAYIRGADAAVHQATGHSTVWSIPGETPGDDQGTVTDGGSVPAQHSLSSIKDKAVLAGRSIYYGALLYAGHVAGGFWLTVLLQALTVLAAMVMTLRALGGPVGPRLGVMCIVLAALTPISFFVGFLMPDIFAGLTILSCAVLLTLEKRCNTHERWAWFVILGASLTFHTSHVLIAALMLLLGLVVIAFRRQGIARRGMAMIGLALVFSAGAEAAFRLAVDHFVGAPPLSPPFLAARVIGDGPGYAYLRDTCPASGFKFCDFVGVMPLTSDEIIWEADPAKGIFAATDPATRRLLSAEQYRLAFAVLAHDPVGEVLATLRNIAAQLALMSVATFEYPMENRVLMKAKIPAQYFDVVQRSGAYLHTMPLTFFTSASYLSAILALVYLANIAFRVSKRQQLPAYQRLLTLFVLAGVLVNAVVCGALSTPSGRYQTRVIWLLPFVALLADFTLRREWWQSVFVALRLDPPLRDTELSLAKPVT